MRRITMRPTVLGEFLSLYSVVRNDTPANGNAVAGSRGDMVTHLQYGGVQVQAELSALFGTGAANTGMIREVKIGGTGNANPLAKINAALGNLGITSAPSGAHENHFHVYFRPPVALELGSNQLVTNQQIVNSAQSLQTSLQTNEEPLSMLVTVPAIPAQDVPTVQVQSSNEYLNGKHIERGFSYCTDVASSAGDDRKPYAESADNSFTPVTREMQRLVGDKPPYDLISKLKKYTAKVITAPKHGIVELIGGQHWDYKPEWNYEGADQAEFLVEVNGRNFKVTVNFWVMHFVPENRKELICRSQKFGSALNIAPENQFILGFSAFAENDELPNDFRAEWGAYLNWMLPINIDVHDLESNALAETVGEGVTAQITLDTNAAGHGWFIDNTPDQNDEFLPTSNPDVWIAKAGSAADGKMDMLSVLLHEYGHALGIAHSGDDGDFMAASLQPGERRLPSQDELSLMARLVAALKQTSSDPSDASDSTASGSPVSSLSLMSWNQLRRADYGWALDTRQTQLVSRVDLTASLEAQKETAVNP